MNIPLVPDSVNPYKLPPTPLVESRRLGIPWTAQVQTKVYSSRSLPAYPKY